ncbi:conserved Plasmodium protein, unknown function [Plasmodium gallinaceum]|uniref:DNA-directed RNA polymerase III subunit RPC3 n=1 Tax=Plasmodium gallinaceum TaxID=5849 RepID=A0A1J1GW11_PLAGA|nr:conserved Plasmodium protein, unknown function [Plasmodium gallinaceum]CRG96508.1 conserved Plasmodium protein, unknown function [Plasmodium gallinaceum]
MINSELEYLKYIISDIFGYSCSEIVELILIYGNKLTINEIINLSNYEFNIVRNIILCLLIHNILDVNIIYNKSDECNHVSVDDKNVNLSFEQKNNENFFNKNTEKNREMNLNEINLLPDNENYKYMKGCKCAFCICKIKRVEYFVIIKNIYILVRYSSIFYYMHPTCINKRNETTIENVNNTNIEYNFFYSDNTFDDNMNYLDGKDEQVLEKDDTINFIEKIILIRIIKSGRITIDNCLKDLKHDDYVEVCKKKIPNISRKKLRLIFLQLLKKKFIKKCKYFNEHICENNKEQNENLLIYDNSINYININYNKTLDDNLVKDLNDTENNFNNINNNNNKINNNSNSNSCDNNNYNIIDNNIDNILFYQQMDNDNDTKKNNLPNINEQNNDMKINSKKSKKIHKETSSVLSNKKKRKTNVSENNVKKVNIYQYENNIDEILTINDESSNKNENKNIVHNNNNNNTSKKYKEKLLDKDIILTMNKKNENSNKVNYSNDDTSYFLNKEDMQNNLLEYLDNPYTYFQANSEVLSLLYLKQECFNFITNYYNLNEITKCILFYLLKNVQLNYSMDNNNYNVSSSFSSFENIEKYVIEKLKKKKIFIDKNTVLQNLNMLIKYPDNLIKTQCNEVISYASDFSNIKTIYRNKIISNIIENMIGLDALRIWNFLISTSDEKSNDEIISENVLIPLNDVRKKLYNLLYHGFIKCHECNNSNNNKTYIKHSLSFSTNIYYTSNKIKENLFTVAKNIYIRKFYENNEINTLHNKLNICVSDKDNNKKANSLTSREYAVDYLEISLINVDKFIFIFNA